MLRFGRLAFFRLIFHSHLLCLFLCHFAFNAFSFIEPCYFCGFFSCSCCWSGCTYHNKNKMPMHSTGEQRNRMWKAVNSPKHTYRSVGQIAVEYWSVSVSTATASNHNNNKNLLFSRISQSLSLLSSTFFSSAQNNWSKNKHFFRLRLLLRWHFFFFFCVNSEKKTYKVHRIEIGYEWKKNGAWSKLNRFHIFDVYQRKYGQFHLII